MGASTQYQGELKSHFVMQILWFVTIPFLFIKPGSCTNLVPLQFKCLMVAPVFIYNSNALARIFLIKNWVLNFVEKNMRENKKRICTNAYLWSFCLGCVLKVLLRGWYPPSNTNSPEEKKQNIRNANGQAYWSKESCPTPPPSEIFILCRLYPASGPMIPFQTKGVFVVTSHRIIAVWYSNILQTKGTYSSKITSSWVPVELGHIY